MALINVPVSSSGTPITVAFQGGSTSGQVLYTVPAGKTWVGTATISSGYGTFTINTVPVSISLSSYGSSPMLPLALTEGTVVTWSAGNSVYMVGVES